MPTLRSLLLFLLFPAISLAQDEYAFKQEPLSQVMAEAARTQKPVFAMLYASWCPHCHKMKKEILPDKEVSGAIESRYIVAGFDAETDPGREFIRKYGVNGYPAFLFLSPTGELLYSFSGEKGKQAFLEELRDAADTGKQLPTLKARFETNPTDPLATLTYVYALRKAGMRTQPVAGRYFESVPDGALVTEMNWRIFANGVSSLESREFRNVFENPKAWALVSSGKRVDRKLENIQMEALKTGSESGQADQYRKQRTIVSNLKTRMGDSLLFVFDRQFYARVGDWKSYVEATMEKVDLFAPNSLVTLRNTAEIYLDHTTDKAALRKAVTWAEKAEKIQTSKDAILLIGRLQEKAGDTQAAVRTADRAIALCNQLGFDSKEAIEFKNSLAPKK